MKTLARLVWSFTLALALGGCKDGPFWDQAPAAPRGLYSVTGDNQVSLFWLANTEGDLDGYNIYYSVRGATGPFKFMAFTRRSEYTDTDVHNGSTYWYAVAAVDRGGHESDLSAENIHDTPRPEFIGDTLYNANFEQGRGRPYDLNALNLDTSVRYSRDSGHADIYFAGAPGSLQLVPIGAHTGIQDGGYTPGGIEDYDFAPNAGWQFNSGLPLVPGHTVLVWTQLGHYAKLYIRELTVDRIVFDWAYQVDPGNRELKPVPATAAR